ncbi:MAG TPA: gamma-glutamylcyclotransferase family protein [Candidatus Udaeobacter sp.]
MKYFTYGSNMLEQRLRAKNRVPNAAPFGAAIIKGYQLRFHKTSRDESGKCNIFKTGDHNDAVYGVVFEVPEDQLKALDKAEGRDYHHEPLKVTLLDGDHLCTLTYVAGADVIDESMIPYDWYHELVIAGAEQHQLPAPYVAALREVHSKPDPEKDRPEKREAEAALRAYRETN